MSQLQVTGEAKIRDIQGPVVANSGVITALDGAASQYVRGDGTLADFPTSSGGGSSVSYYLNSSVSQGTIGGVAYRELSKDPIIGAGTDIAISSNGYVASYITDANDPDVTIVPGGNFNCEFYFSVNNNTGNPFTYAELYKYDGTTFTLLGSSVGVPEYINQGTIIAPYYFAIPVPTSALALTDRLAIRIYVNVDGRTVTLHTENSHLCQVVTTLSKGMVSLNNLTDQSQFLTTGTSGTNFSIASSGDTHTFNLPVASATNTGKLSSTDWSTFNNKQNALTNPITGLGASGNVAYFDSASSITSENSFNYDASTNRLGVNTTVPNATIGANAGTDSGYSLLLKNDNANYNGIGFGTDSTYGNLISTEKQGTALTRNLTLLNQSGFVSLTEAGNLGLGLLTPNTGLDIYNGTSAYLWLHTATSGTSGTDGVRLALFNTNGANLRNFEGSFSITAEGDFSVITLGAENFKINSADGSIYQSKVANAMLKTVSGVLTAAVAGTDYLAPSAISGTTNTVAKFASSSTIGNSNITDTGSLITLGSTTNISSGNFGVGTSSPAVAGVGIDIYSATSAGLRFHTATSGTTVSDGAGINFSAANNLGITNYEAGAIDIVTNGNSGVYIASNGYVGINGATPSVALTVNGDALISGLTANYLPKAGTGGLLGNSQFYDNGTYTAIGTNNVSFNRKLTIYSAAADSHLVLVGAAPSVRFVDNFTATYSSLFGMATASNNYLIGAVAGDFAITCNSSNSVLFGNSDGGAQRMKLTGAGDLAIGTTAPDTKLDVRGEISLSYSASNGLRFYNQDRSNWSSIGNNIATGSSSANLVFRTAAGVALTLDTTRAATFTGALSGTSATFSGNTFFSTGSTSGGVGIGTSTLVTSYTGSNILQFEDNSFIQNVVGNQMMISYNAYLAPAGWTYATTAPASAVRFSSQAQGDISFHTAPSGTAGTAISNWDTTGIKMYITPTGNIGIGTSSPLQTSANRVVLTVNTPSSVGSTLINLGNNGNLGSYWYSDYNNYTELYSAGLLGFIASGSQPMTFATTGGERMRITSGGKLLVNTTTSSVGGTGGDRVIELNGNIYSKGTDAGYFWNDRSNASNFYGWYTTSNTIFLFNGTANAAQINPSTGIYTPLSDINKKKDLELSTIGLDAVLGLKPTLYRIKSDETEGDKELGFIAQEVKEFIPQAYVESGEEDDKFIGLNFNAITAGNTKAIQELYQLVLAQDAKIEELKALIATK